MSRDRLILQKPEGKVHQRHSNYRGGSEQLVVNPHLFSERHYLKVPALIASAVSRYGFGSEKRRPIFETISRQSASSSTAV